MNFDKTYFDKKLILLNGEPTYLLSTWLTDYGRAYCVSGPSIYLEGEVELEELDHTPVDLTTHVLK